MKEEIIRKKELTPEFYLSPEKADQRYNELLKENKEVYLEPLFRGRLWIITYDKQG